MATLGTIVVIIGLAYYFRDSIPGANLIFGQIKSKIDTHIHADDEKDQ